MYELSDMYIENNLNLYDDITFSFKKPTHDLLLEQPEKIKYVLSNFLEYMDILLKKKDEEAYTYFSIFMFLENFLNRRISFFNRGAYNSFSSNIISSINLCYIYILRLYRRVARNFNLYSFLYVLATSFYYKDVILLKNFLIEKIRKLSFKKHKRLLSMLRYAFRLIGSMMIRNQSILGFKMLLTGKIGMAGSTKKKKWNYRIGMISMSTKKNRLKFETFQLWTRTGCLGVKLYIAF